MIVIHGNCIAATKEKWELVRNSAKPEQIGGWKAIFTVDGVQYKARNNRNLNHLNNHQGQHGCSRPSRHQNKLDIEVIFMKPLNLVKLEKDMAKIILEYYVGMVEQGG
jgi:hypothetical protein